MHACLSVSFRLLLLICFLKKISHTLSWTLCSHRQPHSHVSIQPHCRNVFALCHSLSLSLADYSLIICYCSYLFHIFLIQFVQFISSATLIVILSVEYFSIRSHVPSASFCVCITHRVYVSRLVVLIPCARFLFIFEFSRNWIVDKCTSVSASLSKYQVFAFIETKFPFT